MALDGNERKILYRNLINDPATQAETKKYSFTDWERKLLGDEKAIGKLAQFSVGRNWAIDENDFVERYVPELIAPPAPKQQPAPVAAPVIPMAGEETMREITLPEVTAYGDLPKPGTQMYEAIMRTNPPVGSDEYNLKIATQNQIPTPELGAGGYGGAMQAPFETKEQIEQETKSPVFRRQGLAEEMFSGNIPAVTQEDVRKSQRGFGAAPKERQEAALMGGTGAELQQQREDEKLTKAEIVGEEANKFLSGINRAVYKTPSAIAKTIGELGVGVINMLGGDMKSEESVLYNLADKYDKWLDTSEIARDWIGDPRYKGLATDVGSGLGQIATMIAAGPGSASRALMSSPGVIKAVAQKMFSRPSLIAGAQVFNSEYENMKAKGESDETAFKQALTNWFATAPLENLPIVNLAERLNKTVGVQATRRIINAIQQGVDEGGQETLQQLFSNFSNNALVELNKNVVDWTEGLQPSAEAGGVVGLLIGALANARAAKRYTTKPAEAPGVQAIPAEEVQGTGRRVVVDSIEEVPAEFRNKVMEVSGPLGRFGIGKKQYVYFEPTETIDITPQAPTEVTPESAVIEEPPIEELTPVTEETEQVTVPPLTEEELAQIEETKLTPEEEAALLAQEETAPAPAEEEGLQPGERRIGGAIVKTGYAPTLAVRPSQQTVEQQTPTPAPPTPTGVTAPFAPSVSFGDIKLSPQKHIGETISVEHNGEQKEYTIAKVGTDYVLVTDENGDRISIPIYEWSRNVNEPITPAEAAPEIVSAAPVEEVAPEAPAAPAPKGRKKKEAPVTPALAAPKPIEFGKQLEKKYGVRIDLLGKLDKGDLTLSRIEVPQTERGKGIGSKIMEEIIKYADKNGKRIVLSPTKEFGATSVDRLRKFYKGFGFVENKGSNKDFTIKELMYRLPTAEVKEVEVEAQPAPKTKEGKKAEAKEEKVAAPSFTSSQSSEAATAFDKAKTSKGFDKKYGKGAYKALSDITKNFDAIMDKVSDKIKQDCL